MISRVLLFISFSLFSMLVMAQPPNNTNLQQARKHFNDGVKLGIDKKYDQSIEAFEKAIERNPIYAEAFLYRGLAEVEIEEYENAIKSLTIAIELDPRFSDQAHYFRGVARTHQGNFDAAIDDLSVSIRMNPDFISFFQRGRANYLRSEYIRSLQDFDISLRLNPEFAEGYFYRAKTLYHLQEFTNAMDDIEIAKQHLKDNPDVFYYSGLIRTGIRNNDVAIEDLDRAIELNPEYAEAFQARSTAQRNLNRNQRANEDLAEAQRLHEKNKGAMADTSLEPATEAAQNPAEIGMSMTETHKNAPPETLTEEIQTPKKQARSSTEIDFAQLFNAGRTHESQEEKNQQEDASSGETPKAHQDREAAAIETETKASGQAEKLAESNKVTPTTDTNSPESTITNIMDLQSGTFNSKLISQNPGGFGVQVASYSNASNLQALAEAYEERYKTPAFINISNVNGRTLYKLILGEFPERTSAEAFRDSMRGSDFPDSFLVVFQNL